MRKIAAIFIVIILIVLLASCNKKYVPNIQKVGMLIEGSVDDQSWNKKGYDGLIAIGEHFNVDIYFKEDIQSKNQIMNAVDEFVRNGVNLIFGHSNTYGRFFMQIASEYPQVHFVYINGSYFDENVTSLSFNLHAMGFFSGMIAGKMSKSKHVGVVAAHEWQPEIEGFYEGVKYQDPSVQVHINFVNDWQNKDLALHIYDQIRAKGVDVVYPLSNYFSKKIIKQASKDNIFALGYLDDQSYIDQSIVLTSTIQHIEKLYIHTARKFNEGQLKGGSFTFDFQDHFISLGKFSEEVPKEYQKVLQEYIDHYIETNLLPNEL